MTIHYKLVHPNAKFGELNRKTDGSAGCDLYTVEDVIIKEDQTLVRTGVCLDMSSSNIIGSALYAQLHARSSLYARHACTIPNGVSVIDNDYQGEILVPLIYTHHQPEPFVIIPAGTAIAQLVFQYYFTPLLQEVEEFKVETVRGDKGFGSTDVDTTDDKEIMDKMIHDPEANPFRNHFINGWCGGYIPLGSVYPLW